MAEESILEQAREENHAHGCGCCYGDDGHKFCGHVLFEVFIEVVM